MSGKSPNRTIVDTDFEGFRLDDALRQPTLERKLLEQGPSHFKWLNAWKVSIRGN
eukprot:CAMPEP_0177780356 /NCGR_PEP_ID=MMETSP0491_2-20121128/17153_1 /TAXON_ID=63592 /ORGANISM="Tetraselmis chuii, Strain PLY429" /LENGTH=54 /DNA_ID=CAMNT_0019300109 /DNA_START=269 /DNA_END=430 /DNA_ORIENTATION=+